MRLVRLTKFYDFIQVLHSIRKHSTTNEYFPMHISFSTIYLLQEHKLNPTIYSKQELIMIIFVQANDNAMHACKNSEYYKV
jgi:hypothetical protein